MMLIRMAATVNVAVATTSIEYATINILHQSTLEILSYQKRETENFVLRAANPQQSDSQDFRI